MILQQFPNENFLNIFEISGLKARCIPLIRGPIVLERTTAPVSPGFKGKHMRPCFGIFRNTEIQKYII